jgi:hypothetical protein
VNDRLGGIDTTSDRKFALVPLDNEQHSPKLTAPYSANGLSANARKILVIIGICIVGLLVILLALGAAFAVTNRSKQQATRPQGTNWFPIRPRTSEAYIPLGAPAPLKHANDWG